MSHIVTIDTEIRDAHALGAACRRLNLDQPVLRTARLFSGEATGHCVQLPDWRFPVVCDVEQGRVAYDNYGGRWGEQREMDRLVQAYAIEKARLEARKQGHTVTEQQLADGSVKVTIQVGGTA